MKRNIKFRGKRVESGEWIVGWLFQDDDDHFPMIHQGGTLDDWEQVKEETIGQFTGLTDKKGIEIYEGDILRRNSGTLLVVEYRHGGFGYDLYDGGEFYMLCGDINFKFNHNNDTDKNFEIVGNIYDGNN